MNFYRREIAKFSGIEKIVTDGALVRLAAARIAVAPKIDLRVWCPPESPVRIEYPKALLSEISAPASGVLWGVRDGDSVQISKRNYSRGQLVGKFFSRIRGEVFLTESDLAELDQMDLPDPIALVVAGSKAGFFVRCRDGTMQTVKSYQEITRER